MLAHSRSDARKQKDIVKKELQSVKGLFHVSLCMEELREAKLEVIRSCQKKRFPEEFYSLQKGLNGKLTSHIYKLNLVLDEWCFESWRTAW